MLTAAVVGASGYVGGELVRLLLGHPHVELTQVTSERLVGRYVHSVHPNLRGATRLKFRSADDLEPVDVLFLCLPHGEAARRIAHFAALAHTVVDCSADFRLRDPAWHARWYGEETVCPEWRSRFVYGLPELERERLRGAQYISGVGCNATAVNVALWPLARAGLIEQVVVEVKVGSSEGGARASSASHHPERAGAVRSFAPVGHRHQAEVCQALGVAPEQLFFSATAIEMVRGVLATAHVFLSRPVVDRDLWQLYRAAYGQEPFVRLVRDRTGIYRLPEPKILAGTNFCDVGWAVDDHGRRVVVILLIN
ncbi:MAG: N-acetyl-gamma-glutamyl-phosphate reductase [Ardenticatenia bacterium]|nr:N-acetyl-gamma-glutamyl-phosphate reductase [Ardenticatenia bacterium]